MIKKFLSALLAVLMVVSMVPLAAMATSDSGTSDSGGTTGTADFEVHAAKLHDTRNESEDAATQKAAIADNALCEGYDAEVTDVSGTPLANGNYKVNKVVTLKGSNLQAHMNAEETPAMGYWVGVAFVAPEGATKYKVASSMTNNDTILPNGLIERFTGTRVEGSNESGDIANKSEPAEVVPNVYGTKPGYAQYFDLTTVSDKKHLYVMIQWLKDEATAADNGEAEFAPVVYEIKLEVTEDTGKVVAAPTNQSVAAVKDITLTAHTAIAQDGFTDVALHTPENVKLPAHANTKNEQGYWAGFSVVAPKGATKVKYAFGTTEDSVNTLSTTAESLEANVDGKGNSGIAFYADAGSATPKKYAAVQWLFDNEGKCASVVTKYQIDLAGVKLVEPSITAVGYRDSAAKAKEQIKADRLAAEGKTTGDTSAGSDSDIKTMWVVMKDLPVVSDENGAKDYRVHVTEPDGTTAVALNQASSSANKVGPDTAFNTDTGYKAIWWTFNQEATGGTVASKDIQVGEYKFQLQKKTGTGDSATWTNVGESNTLTLAGLTVKKSEDDQNPDKYYIDTAAKKTLTELGISISDPTPVDGKVFRGWQKGNETPISTAALSASTITANTTYTAVIEDKQDLHVDVATEAIKFTGDTGDGMAPSKLGSFTVAQADANNVIKVTGTAKYVIWDKFSSKAEEKAGNYVALKLVNETGDEKIKVTSSDGERETELDDGILVVYLGDGSTTTNDKRLIVKVGTNEYTLDLTGVRMNIATITFAECAGTDKLGSQVLSALTDNFDTNPCAHSKPGQIDILGTSHYTVFPDFHGTDTAQQRGHYVAMNITIPESIASDADIKVNSPTENIEKTLGADGIWVIRVENFEDVDPQIKICIKGTEIVLYSYTLCLDGLNLEDPKTDATIKSVEIGTAAITISDTPTAGSIYTGIKATFPANTDDSELSNATVKLTVDKDASVRYFNASHNTEPPGEALWANNANIAANNNGTVEITNVKLKWDESQDDTFYFRVIAQDGKNSELYKVTAVTSEIAVAPIPAPSPTVSEAIPTADVTAVTTAGTNTNVADDSKGTLTGSALTAVEEDTTKDQAAANAAINAADGLTLSEGQNALIYVVPSMKVEATKYEKDSSDAVTSYTVDITPIVTVYASTAAKAEDVKLPGTGVNDANSVQMGQPIKLTTLDTPITIEIGVPSALASEDENVYIAHKSDRFLRKVTSSKVSVTVGSFSPFTITKATEAVLSNITVSAGSLTFDPDTTNYTVNVANTVSAITVTGTPLAGLTNPTVTYKKNGTVVTGPIALDEGKNTIITIEVADDNMTTPKAYTITVFREAKPVTPVGPSGPSTPTTYQVKVSAAENGKVSASATSAAQGATVTLTVTPDEGYELDKLTVTDASGKAVTVTGSGSRYTFTMPGGAVTVSVSFKKAAPWQNPFGDVKEGAWYYDAVKYVKQNKLMNGNEKGQFEPDKDLTRAEFAAILYNKEGQPATTWSNVFTDVPEGAWFAKQVVWAANKNILAGYGNGKAGPNDPVKREELAVLLWKYEGRPAPKSTTLSFPDAGKVSSWAKDAMLWATENGVINGTTSGGTVILAPQGSASRAESAQMLMNYFGKK